MTRSVPSWLLVAALLPGAVEAGRPLDTDDAAIIPRGTCQLESFARRVHAGRETRFDDYGIAPSCDPVGWGEILLGGGRASVGDEASLTQGLLQLKVVPRQVSTTSAGWGVDLSYEQDYQKGRKRPAARTSSTTAIASVPIASGWQADANLGLAHAWAPAPGDRNHVLWGVALEWLVSPTFSIVGERTGVRRSGETSQLGFTFTCTPRLTLDGAIGRRNLPDRNATFATVGFTLVSRTP